VEPQICASTQMSSQTAIVPTALISQKILFVRGTRVMLDADLARLYGVATKNLNKAVKRNASRFPSDFMFQLSPKELHGLGFQFGTSKPGRGGRRYAPHAFTEQGVAMLSSVLRSSRAVQVTSRSCEPSFGFAKCSQRTKNCAEKLTQWKSGTMRDFRPFLRLFARCCKHPFRRKNRSDFTPDLNSIRSLASQ
jgi:hypothetical protein